MDLRNWPNRPEPVPSSASSKTNERDQFCQGLSKDHLGGGYLRHPEKMRLRVCDREWKEFKEDMSKIPLYLLRYLKIHDDEVTLRLADLLYRHRRAICSAIAATADITQVVAMVWKAKWYTWIPEIPSFALQTKQPPVTALSRSAARHLLEGRYKKKWGF